MYSIFTFIVHSKQNDSAFWFLIIIAGIIGAYQLYNSDRAVVTRKMANIKELKISEVLNGEYVKVRGKVYFAGKTLKAPLSGRECVYYHVKVEERSRSSKSNRTYTIIDEEKLASVVIENDNQYAYIDPRLVRSYVLKDMNYSSGFLNDATEDLKNYLKKHGREPEDVFGFNRSLSYEEGVLEKDEEVIIIGKANWRRASDLRLNIPQKSVLVISADNKEPAYFTDDTDYT